MSNLTWDATAPRAGTFFRDMLPSPYSFTETVARLKAASGQDPTALSDQYKVAVEFAGTYRGEPFTLYDYKCSEDIHIGGTQNLNVGLLVLELLKILDDTAPVPFRAPQYYEGDDLPDYVWPDVVAEPRTASRVHRG